ncbi:MAG: hypothetical protein AB1553_13525 [Nitrospirota bacterium]
MNTVRLICLALLAVFVLTGCGGAPPKKEDAPTVFYPDPPEPPRIQYLTSFTSARDVEAEKSAFDVFITGKKDDTLRLDKPYGVAMHNGKIYVCDTNSTVMVFDLEKRAFAPLIGAKGLGKLAQPLNISIDRDGNKYVADPLRGQVVVFDKNDLYARAIGISAGWKPVDAVVYENELYVADIQNGEIKVFDKNTGDLLRKLGQRGDLNQRLAMPTNIAFDSTGDLLVSDAGIFRVVRMDRDGHIKTTIGGVGANIGKFARPKGIAIDREDRLYVVDAAFDNVQMFNKDGYLLLFFGKAGRKAGDLYLPAKVAIDYDNVRYFQKYADPNFTIEYLILVTSQFGDRMVNVYGFGKERGRRYPTDEELKKLIEERIERMRKEEQEREKAASEEDEKKK